MYSVIELKPKICYNCASSLLRIHSQHNRLFRSGRLLLYFPVNKQTNRQSHHCLLLTYHIVTLQKVTRTCFYLLPVPAFFTPRSRFSSVTLRSRNTSFQISNSEYFNRMSMFNINYGCIDIDTVIDRLVRLLKNAPIPGTTT